MRGRISPGPVFVYESILAARRWQHYAGRAVFVLLILIGLWIVWSNSATNNSVAVATPTGQIVYQQTTSLQQLAQVGEGFFYTLVIVQLSIVMLAAPAATAGSICIDRARGSLLHVMVTDLSDSEIVLGKMASRLVPTLGLIAAALPVASIGALLGGIDLDALTGLMVVSVGLAVLGCTLSMAVALVATKVHEVLMAVYLIEGMSLLIVPFWRGVSSKTIPPPPDVLVKLNPYVLAIAPYAWPRYVVWSDFAIFAAFSLAVSGVLTLICVLSLRKVAMTSPGHRRRFAFFGPPAWLTRYQDRSGPTLDSNPVLWREWHRNRPSRFSRMLWALLWTLTWGSVLMGFVEYLAIPPGVAMARGGFIDMGMIIQMLFGLLFFCAMAPTSLAEERMRGSLDVLISTPLTTREIVAGKWWGSFRMILPIAILPVLIIVFYSAVLPAIDPAMAGIGFGEPIVPLNLTDRIVATPIMLGQLMSTGALIASLGIWLATRIQRVGRAVTAGVILFFVLGIGWAMMMELVVMPLYHEFWSDNRGYDQTFMNATMSVSLLGPVISLSNLQQTMFEPREWIWVMNAAGSIVKGCIALLLFNRTVRIFDRHLGRVPEGGAPLPRRRPEFPDTQADPLPAQRLEPA